MRNKKRKAKALRRYKEQRRKRHNAKGSHQIQQPRKSRARMKAAKERGRLLGLGFQEMRFRTPVAWLGDLATDANKHGYRIASIEDGTNVFEGFYRKDYDEMLKEVMASLGHEPVLVTLRKRGGK